MATASTVALAMAAGSPASAQDAGPQWWASIQGQYAWFDGEGLDAYFVNADPDHGFSGRVLLGAQIGGGWSAAFGLRYTKASKESDSFYYYYSEFERAGADGSYKEDHIVADLEIGRDVGLGGGAMARVFGGVRFVRMDGDGSFNAFYSDFDAFYGVDAHTDHRFTGAGPRIGADINIPVAENVMIDLGVAGAAIYGKRKIKISGQYSSFGEGERGGSFSYSDSDKAIIPNVEASVALSYLLGQSAKLSAGYRAEKYFNVMPDLSGGHADRFMHGPFVQLTIIGN